MTDTVLPLLTSDYTGSTALVGGDEGLRDNSDATYASLTVNTPTLTSSFRFAPPDPADFLATPHPLGVRMRYEFTSGPTGVGSPAIQLQWVANGDSTLYLRPNRDADWSTSPGIHDLTWSMDTDLYASLGFSSTALWSHPGGAATWEDAWTNWVQPPDFPSWLQVDGLSIGGACAYTIHIYELSFVYTTGAPPVARLWPRDDGRGISSAPRIVPPPKANRIIGGYQ